MDDHYHHFLTSMSGVGCCSTISADELAKSTHSGYLNAFQTPTMGGSYPSVVHLGTCSDKDLFQTSDGSKARRKAVTGHGFGHDHIKHRRTRSGCFMCRSRRVKVTLAFLASFALPPSFQKGKKIGGSEERNQPCNCYAM